MPESHFTRAETDWAQWRIGRHGRGGYLASLIATAVAVAAALCGLVGQVEGGVAAIPNVNRSSHGGLRRRSGMSLVP